MLRPCIQLKPFSLGFTLVLCFGIGLAITMLSAGVLAVLSPAPSRTALERLQQLRVHRAPHVSAALIVVVGLYTGWLGLSAI